jgi:hypothetical protein
MDAAAWEFQRDPPLSAAKTTQATAVRDARAERRPTQSSQRGWRRLSLVVQVLQIGRPQAEHLATARDIGWAWQGSGLIESKSPSDDVAQLTQSCNVTVTDCRVALPRVVVGERAPCGLSGCLTAPAPYVSRCDSTGEGA